MKKAPVLEIKKPLSERIALLVEVYSDHGVESLEEATLRISRRLGPQRTQKAVEAIKVQDWSQACLAMIDYYDRCYDHELLQANQLDSIDLAGLSPEQAAQTLVKKGLVN